MRYENFASGEYYHIFSRGSGKKEIFLDNNDYSRFILLITHLQSPTKINNISWYNNSNNKKMSFLLNDKKLEEILNTRYIELVCFALMPNHFHLIIKNSKDGIISVFMQRVLTSYSKYFNTKYKKVGHVFDGPFGAVHVDNNEQLLHLSAYIHKNPKSINGWEDCYNKYPWSSYSDYIEKNRWGELLKQDIVLDQFKNQIEYINFVETSLAKEKSAEQFFE